MHTEPRAERPRSLKRAWPRRYAFFRLLRTVWYEYEHDHARYFALAMVYYALFSLVPLLLLLLGTLGLALRFSVVATAAEQEVLLLVGTSFGPELKATIEALIDRLRQESVVATIVSLAALLLAGSVLFGQLRLAFRAIWKYQPPLVSGSVRVVLRTKVREQVIAFAMMATAGVLLVVGLGLFAAVQWLSGLFGNAPLIRDATAWLLGLTGPTVIVTLTFALLFKFLPPVRLPWRHVWLASVLCAAGWMVIVEGLALYGAYFGRSSAYGAIGGLLAIMLSMNLVSQLLFYGAELCKVVAFQEGRPVIERPLESRRRAG